MEDRECNTYRWYDPMEGYCIQTEQYCHGYDGDDCPDWQKGWSKDDPKD